MVRHIIVLRCHVGDIYVFVSSCKCYSRLVNVCHGFVPSCFCYFCHSNVLHAHACHAIVCHAIVTSCKCLSCKRDHVNERHTSASSRVPRWLPLSRNKLGDFIDRHAPDLVIQQDLSLKLDKATRSDTTTYTFKAKFKDGTEVTSNTLLQVRCECLILEIDFVLQYIIYILLRLGQSFAVRERPKSLVEAS